MKPRALILGGTGFVGPYLGRQLADRYSVAATGRDHDIRNADAIYDLVSRNRPDLVVNLAAITTVRESFERSRETYETGFFGLDHLFGALQACGFSGRVLHVSSSEIYGFPRSEELPLTEAAPPRPMSPYAVAKAAGELLCYQWAQQGRFEIFLARPFTHIGPGQSSRFAVAKFARQIAAIIAGKQEPVIAAGNLRTTRDLTDVRDIVRAYDAIIHRGEAGKAYNVCCGIEITMLEVINKLIDLSNIAIKIVQNPLETRTSEQQRICGSYAALSAATGWRPEVPLDRTLADMIAHEREER